MAPTSHSPYSPSQAEIYFACPGSIASQSEAGEKKTSKSAKDGQRAHFLGETSLRENKHPSEYVFESLRNTENSDTFSVSEHLAECVGMYYEVVQRILANAKNPHMLLEVKLAQRIYGIDIFGTADCVIVDGSTLHIIDYKHGSRHAVDAVNNKQLLIYALLADGVLGEFTDFHLVIVQPNEGGEKEWWQSAHDIAQFKRRFEEAIQETLDNPNKLVPGDHCLWCKAQPKCGAYTSNATEHLTTRNKVIVLPVAENLSDIELADYVHRMSQFLGKARASLKTAEALATQRLIDGKILSGLELREKRSSRDWTNTAAVVAKFGDKAITKSIKSPAQIEKTLKLKKGELEQLGLITTVPGSLQLSKTDGTDFTDLDETTD